MEHVGYKGSSPMHNDLLAGTIKLAIDTLPQNVPFMKDGRLKALAVTSSARASMAPDCRACSSSAKEACGGELPRRIGARRAAAAGRRAAARRGWKKSLADPKIAQRLAELGVQGRDCRPRNSRPSSPTR